MPIVIPTYSQGFARNAAQSAYPELWRGLVGLWSPSLGPTGLTLRDWSGNQNHGALTNMDAATDWVVGEKGYALDYDGDNDFIGNSNFQIQFEHITINAWVRGVGRGPEAFPGFFDLSDSSNNLVVGFGGDSLAFDFRFLVADAAHSNFILLASPRSRTDWEMYTATYDRTTARIYKNGIEVNSVSIGTQAAQDISKLAIGLRRGIARNWNGQIGDVSIYNRALAQQEIAAMFVGASPLILRERGIGKVPSVGLLLKQSNMDGGLQHLNGGLM